MFVVWCMRYVTGGARYVCAGMVSVRCIATMTVRYDNDDQVGVYVTMSGL